MLTNSNTVLDSFCNSLGDLVKFYGNVAPQISLVEESAASHDFTAIIGLCDIGLSASIALSTDAETLKSLSSITLVDLADWLGELSNQLAGRFKNKLCQFGLQPQLTTPTTVSGKMLMLGALAGEVHVYSMRWPTGQFEAQLSLELDESLELRLDPALASAEEGSLDLF